MIIKFRNYCLKGYVNEPKVLASHMFIECKGEIEVRHLEKMSDDDLHLEDYSIINIGDGAFTADENSPIGDHFIEIVGSMKNNAIFRLITDDAVFLCNDEGQTIETVFPNNIRS